MVYKKLGNTTVKLSAVGIGTGFGDREIFQDRNKIISTIRTGIDLGLNFIDTGENYAEGKCEEIIGKSIKGVRDKVILASKFSPEHSSSNDLIKACDMSLKRLATDYIDIYQFHWPNPNVHLSETLLALSRLLKIGKIRYVGLGNFSKKDIEYSKKILKNKIVSLQMEYNLFERTIEENGILSCCQKIGLSLIAYSPLDQGRISSMNKSQKYLMEKLCKKYSKSLAQIMLRFLIEKPRVVVIPKTTKISHLIENVQTMDFDMDEGDIDKINESFAQEISYIPTSEIRISKNGERNHPVYQTLEEAIANKLGFVPSPVDLSKSLIEGNFLKPVRVVKLMGEKGSFKYDLIGGRIRYWAWVIAYGSRKAIPAYVRKNLSTN